MVRCAAYRKVLNHINLETSVSSPPHRVVEGCEEGWGGCGPDPEPISPSLLSWCVVGSSTTIWDCTILFYIYCFKASNSFLFSRFYERCPLLKLKQWPLWCINYFDIRSFTLHWSVQHSLIGILITSRAKDFQPFYRTCLMLEIQLGIVICEDYVKIWTIRLTDC